jgi:hypothetical protein
MIDRLIRRAISRRLLVAFQYHGRRRVGEPHIYGKTNGKVQLLVYQTGGTSASGAIPDWRRCDVDEISGFVVLTETFRGSRLGPSADHSDWDATWAIVQ